MGIDQKLNKLADFVIAGKYLDASKITRELLDNNVDPRSILDQGLMKGMDVVGQRFRDQQMFVPQVLVSARAMKKSLNLLEPLLVNDSSNKRGKVVIGTVKGDVHDIGKNLVTLMLQGAGFEVIDLGTGCDAKQFIDAYYEHKPDVIGLSALLTTTMTYMNEVVCKFKEKGLGVPIIIGGAPLNQKYADSIGAAGYARNAYEAVRLVDKIIKDNKPVN